MRKNPLLSREEKKERKRAWAQNNKEKCLRYKRKYRESHKIEILKREKLRCRLNPEKEQKRHQKYRSQNRDEINTRARKAGKTPESRAKSLAKSKRWQSLNREKHLSQVRALRENRKAVFNARTKNWRKANKGKVRTYAHKYRKIRMKLDVSYAIRERTRCRIRMAIKNNSKFGSSVKLLGCSIESLRIYIESKFEPNMTWENWGLVWQLDHIMPCAIFDLSKPEHQRRCFHFSNLQPLFVADNLRKSDQVLSDQYPLI